MGLRVLLFLAFLRGLLKKRALAFDTGLCFTPFCFLFKEMWTIVEQRRKETQAPIAKYTPLPRVAILLFKDAAAETATGLF